MGVNNNAQENEILLRLMSRDYLGKFPEIDLDERNNLIFNTVQTAGKLNIPILNKKIKELSQTDPNMKIRSEAIKVLKSQSN